MEHTNELTQTDVLMFVMGATSVALGLGFSMVL